MTKIANIRKTIQSTPLGEPFLSSELLSLASRNCIDQTLYRLEKEGEIKRIARGIYIRPKQNRFIGTVLPSPFNVAKKLNDLVGEVVQVNGAEAARQLGLSTQVPTQSLYWTTGQNRCFQLGEQKVTLKHVPPRKVAYAGSKIGLAISALWYLGKKGVSFSILQKIKEKMNVEEYSQFKNAIHIMPAWLGVLFQKFEEQHVL
jgi:hypothetical protein